MTPESELVFLCTRVRIGSGQRDRIRALLDEPDPLDPTPAFALAAAHGVLPLVARNLDDVANDLLPPETVQGLRAGLHERAKNNLMMMSEMLRVTRSFAEQGIETVHFKGPVLAAHAFGNLALREFCDLDVLVHERDARKARELLLADGYRSTLSEYGEDFHLRKSYWLGFAHEKAPIKIDLHWKLADPFFRYEPDLPTLWANTQTIEIGGAVIRTFGPEDTVLVLAAHGFKHGYSRLKWVNDLCEWIRVHPDLDWRGILATADALHVARILAVSLKLVHRLDDSLLPFDVVAVLAEDAKAEVLTRRVWAQIFAGARPLDGWRYEFFHARGRERRRDGCSYLCQQLVRSVRRAVVPNEKDRAMIRLPAVLGFAYYLLRPVRLCGKVFTGGR